MEVAVIGAGVAGLSAAKTLLAAGRSVVVIEARNRLGGRVLSDNTTFAPQPVDLGAQFFHQQDNNPLRVIAESQNIPLIPDFGERVMRINGQLADPLDAGEALATVATFEAALLAAGASAQAGGVDLSAFDANSFLQNEPYYLLAAAALVNGRTGTGIHDPSSSLDLFNFTEYSPFLLAGVGNDIYIPSGMGNFILNTFSPGVPVVLNTPVKEIQWGAKDQVRLVSDRGTLTARTAIITVPTSVLASGRPGFTPALPSAYNEAFATLPLGAVGKVILQFQPNTFPDASGTFAVQLANTEEVTPTVINMFGSNITVSFLDGELMREVERQGAAFGVQTLLDGLAGMYGEGIRSKYTGKNLITNWINDPFSQGAYSAARPGHVGARTQLMQPIANQLFFAGEALSLVSHGSIHAAYLSAQAAAQAALLALA